MRRTLGRLTLFNTLRFRVLVMLTLALLPVGMIAVIQTNQLAATARINAELALLARTEKATLDERNAIEQARGAARLMGSVVRRISDTQQCEIYLKRYVRANQRFSFIGVIPASGIMRCSSAGGEFDYSQGGPFQTVMTQQKPLVTVARDAPHSKTSVIVVSEPYFEDGKVAGMVSVSVPHASLSSSNGVEDEAGFVNVITFNTDGDILTAQGGLDAALADTPGDRALTSLIGQGEYSFTARDSVGRNRAYSIAPIVDGVVYTMGVWSLDQGGIGSWGMWPAWLFPVLMWLASLGVGLFAVHRLVTRHVHSLGRQMNAFASTRAIPEETALRAAPAELAQLQTLFHDMADAILQEEARMEDNLRDTKVLLKEVHHRVKNNLQLISSIMNMQIRKSKSAETRDILSRLQDRVLSLATIHRDLYQSQHAGRVDVGALVREIVEKSIEIGVDDNDPIELRADIEPVLLFPDQAVPASLLAAEAATNAMKYVGHPPNGRRWIEVTFKMLDEGACEMHFANSLGPRAEGESTGLGAQLIRAFAMQLGGETEIEESAEEYRMSIRFQIADFVDDGVDY